MGMLILIILLVAAGVLAYSYFRRRFYISTTVTVPILALSPRIQGRVGISLQVPGVSYILFALSSFVFFAGTQRAGHPEAYQTGRMGCRSCDPKRYSRGSA